MPVRDDIIKHRVSTIDRSRQAARFLSPRSFRFTLLLGLLAALPALSIDINAPTLLVVEQELAGPSGVVALTIAVFMLGFALGQFGAGTLSDRFGRRPVLLLGLLCYSVSAVGCAVATSIQTLIGWRLVQGAGAGAAAVLAFTIVHDLFKGDAARSKRSYVSVVFGTAPILAPSLGAWMLERVGWRPVYLLLAGCGVLMFAAVAFGVQESRPLNVSQGRQPSSILGAYGRLLGDRRFAGLAVVNALSFGGMFAYIAGSPFVLMDRLHVSTVDYGVVFATTGAALAAGAWVSGRLATAGVRLTTMLWIGLSCSAGLAVSLTALLMTSGAELPAIILILVLSMFCRGIVAPNAQHLALEPICEDAGAASAAIGVLQILIGAASSAVVAAVLPAVGRVGMGMVMAIMALGSLALWIRITAAPAEGRAASAVAVAEPGV